MVETFRLKKSIKYQWQSALAAEEELAVSRWREGEDDAVAEGAPMRLS
ncbi:MAG TPA: hypothetical protein VHC19_28435 [Pirellulales bacterium]|jgi:hypothetical protein|nr:hypothetical protein [Pirellulales bacterium]